MVAALGGPKDVLHDAHLALAPVQREVPASHEGVITCMDTRALGLAVVALGGGRQRGHDAVDARVGFSQVRPLGTWVEAGEPLLRIHASTGDAAQQAFLAVRAAVTVAAATDLVVQGIDREIVREQFGP